MTGHPTSERNRNAAGGALIVGGGLVGFFGIMLTGLGLVACFTGNVLSGHLPGLVLLVQGVFLHYVGWRMVRAGKVRTRADGVPSGEEKSR